ncbi:exo-beta-N-acetylmuramidase NamZ domain-containing protein [Geomicrobium sp. JSM 1781026]|uniref:exo-beta-N-acetylmuramidase NamZ domain-containing protein n=1 Tax=Geomicrobium sp. JSM 1781026 TaxID=3344580 RepID=UPI0035BF9EEF
MKNDDNILPLQPESDEQIAVVSNNYLEELEASISPLHSNVDYVELGSDGLTEENWETINAADYVIAATTSATNADRDANHPQIQMVNEIQENADASVIALGVRNPYDIMAYPDVDAYVAQYSFRDASFTASARAIFGRLGPTGKLPVTIPTIDGDDVLYEAGHGLTYDEVEQPEAFQLGVDALLDNLDVLEDKRIGIVTNPTGVTQDLDNIVDVLVAEEDLNVTSLYGPEHGIRGDAQAGDYVEFYIDEETGLPVYSLYGETQKPTPEMLEDVDVLLFDIQDVGTRFYTYIYTMAYLLEAAQENDKEVIVLDRPNPINGVDVEGPVLEAPKYTSFIGNYPIPTRHGMTVGELAHYFNDEHDIGADLTVMEMENYDRSLYFDETELHWVMPSPNMPTVETAVVYPATGIIEGTNLSEGRGTTKPFQLLGAPYVNSTELAAELNSLDLDGVLFRAASFTPMFSKHAGTLSHGVEVHITDRDAYESVTTGLHIVKTIHDLYPDSYQFQPEGGDGISFFDRLLGNGWIRDAIQDGTTVEEMENAWREDLETFKDTRESYLIY